jgi:hypothetical protein
MVENIWNVMFQFATVNQVQIYTLLHVEKSVKSIGNEIHTLINLEMVEFVQQLIYFKR